MGLREYEWFNQVPPLANSPGMRCIAVLPITPTSQNQDLRQLFGQFSQGHFLTIQPEIPTGSAYLAFAGQSGTIIPTLVMGGTGIGSGVGTGVCWNIPANMSMRVAAPVTMRHVGTGMATLVAHNMLQFMSTATGSLRIYRSSTKPDDLTPFPFPNPATDY